MEINPQSQLPALPAAPPPPPLSQHPPHLRQWSHTDCAGNFHSKHQRRNRHHPEGESARQTMLLMSSSAHLQIPYNQCFSARRTWQPLKNEVSGDRWGQPRSIPVHEPLSDRTSSKLPLASQSVAQGGWFSASPDASDGGTAWLPLLICSRHAKIYVAHHGTQSINGLTTAEERRV